MFTIQKEEVKKAVLNAEQHPKRARDTVCLCVCVCARVLVFVFVSTFAFVSMIAFMFVCVRFVCAHVHVRVQSMYACARAGVRLCAYVLFPRVCAVRGCVCVCVCVCVGVRVCVCVRVRAGVRSDVRRRAGAHVRVCACVIKCVRV